jgi:K(+)-stimulated pyrophosphate-energized sodium pump
MGALYKGLIAAGVLSAIAFYFVTNYFITENSLNIFFASLIGLAVTGLLVIITEYYTSTAYSPMGVFTPIIPIFMP